MNQADKKALVALPVILSLALGLAWAGSQDSLKVGEIPVFGLIILLAFAVQWLAFVPAYLLQTEKFFDLTGSLTYISLTLVAFFLRPELDPRSLLVAALVILWATRLGMFLFRRIRAEGKDGRFDELKPSFFRFLNVWNIQALWVSLTASAAFAILTTSMVKALDVYAWVGGLLWGLGFLIEVIADSQKSRFRADPAHRGKFITTGLWSWSRHPNYFGEILLWAGVMVVAIPVLQGWQWVVLISPIFVFLLLTKVSGIPLLEQRADDKWGGQADYEDYKSKTPVLIPKLSK